MKKMIFLLLLLAASEAAAADTIKVKIVVNPGTYATISQTSEQGFPDVPYEIMETADVVLETGREYIIESLLIKEQDTVRAVKALRRAAGIKEQEEAGE